jgi:hypothetical protein
MRSACHIAGQSKVARRFSFVCRSGDAGNPDPRLRSRLPRRGGVPPTTSEVGLRLIVITRKRRRSWGWRCHSRFPVIALTLVMSMRARVMRSVAVAAGRAALRLVPTCQVDSFRTSDSNERWRPADRERDGSVRLLGGAATRRDRVERPAGADALYGAARDHRPDGRHGRIRAQLRHQLLSRVPPVEVLPELTDGGQRPVD